MAKSDNDKYTDRLRSGVRNALRDAGIDVRDSAALGRASATAGLNRRFLQQFLDGTVTSPRSVNMRKLVAFLATTEENLVSGNSASRNGVAKIGDNSGNFPQNSHSLIDKQFVTEYDVRASSSSQDIKPMILIQERPVMQRHEISVSLIKRKMHPNGEPAIIRIVGDSMEPDYQDGSCVLVDAGIRAPSPDGVYVLFDGYSHSIKRCQIIPGSEPAKVRVTAINNAYMPYEIPLTAIRVCGLVVAALDPDTFEEISAHAEKSS